MKYSQTEVSKMNKTKKPSIIAKDCLNPNCPKKSLQLMATLDKLDVNFYRCKSCGSFAIEPINNNPTVTADSAESCPICHMKKIKQIGKEIKISIPGFNAYQFTKICGNCLTVFTENELNK